VWVSIPSLRRTVHKSLLAIENADVFSAIEAPAGMIARFIAEICDPWPFSGDRQWRDRASGFCSGSSHRRIPGAVFRYRQIRDLLGPGQTFLWNTFASLFFCQFFVTLPKSCAAKSHWNAPLRLLQNCQTSCDHTVSEWKPTPLPMCASSNAKQRRCWAKLHQMMRKSRKWAMAPLMQLKANPSQLRS